MTKVRGFLSFAAFFMHLHHLNVDSVYLEISKVMHLPSPPSHFPFLLTIFSLLVEDVKIPVDQVRRCPGLFGN